MVGPYSLQLTLFFCILFVLHLNNKIMANRTPKEIVNLLNHSYVSSSAPEVRNVLQDYFTAPLSDSDSSDSDQESLQESVEQESAEQELDAPLLIIQDNELPQLANNSDNEPDISAIQNFQCGCKLACYTKFNARDIHMYRLDCQGIDYFDENHTNWLNERIVSYFVSGTRMSVETCSTKKVNKRSELSRTVYMFQGINICKQMFLFIHGIGVHRYENLKKRYLTNGGSPQPHKNSGIPRHNKLDSAILNKVVTYILRYSEQNALVLPGRVPGFKDAKLRLLPSADSKSALHKKYLDSCEESQKISLSTFCKIWRKYIPYVATQKPRSDLCDTCQKNTISMSKMANLDEEDKIRLIEESSAHLELAKNERSEYKRQIDKAKSDLDNHPNPQFGVTTHLPRSFNGCSHYSFDYAQQVFIPSSSQQIGPLYFLAPYKVGWFDIMNEAIPKNVIFLIPESANTTKGANAVVSYLDYYLYNFGLGETMAFFHADNCAGQNKNNVVMCYLAWRICCGLHDEIQISFLPKGHTKFGPDWGIGIGKQKFRRSDVNCLDDLKKVIDESSPVTKLNVGLLTADERGNVHVPVSDWYSYFSQIGFHKIPQISKYHYFHFHKDTLGVVTVKKSLNDPDEKSFTIFNDGINVPAHLPDVIPPVGIPLPRAKYLYEKIRPHVNPLYADLLCPEPPEPVDTASNAESDQNQSDSDRDDVTVVKRKSPHCGFCFQVGHRNRLVKGNPLCPKRRSEQGSRNANDHQSTSSV